MNVDIIIPHYGTGRLTELCLLCLESIRRHSTDYRLIFVDNASPEFAAIAPELERHPHLLLRNTTNVGFVRATNVGLMSATAPFVLLLNNDTEAVPGWLEKLAAPLAGDVGLSGPLTTAKGSWQGNWRKTAAGGVHILAPGRMLAFFCAMFRREVFDLVGLLDEGYGVGLGDDDDFCRRAEAAGFRLALVQDLVIPHHHRSTFQTLYSGEEIAGMQRAAMERFKGASCPSR